MKKILDIQDIWRLIPHRHPILMVDGVTEYERGKHIVATRYIREDNPVFVGHFPHFPIMPGVFIVEALAQTGALFMALEQRQWRIGQPIDDRFSATTIGVLGETKVRFKSPVLPDTQLVLRAEVDWQLKNSLCIKVKAEEYRTARVFVSGQLTLTNAPLSILEQHQPTISEPTTKFFTTL